MSRIPSRRFDPQADLPAPSGGRAVGGLSAVASADGDLAACLEHERAARRRAERALHGLRQALDAMQVGVTVTDVEGTIVYVNPADADMHGYAVSELLGRTVGVYSIPEDRQPLTPVRLRKVTSWRREGRNARKDGSTFPVQLLSDVVRDEDGEPIGVVTTCEDISDRRLLEASRRAAREELDRRVAERTADLEGEIRRLTLELAARERAADERPGALHLAPTDLRRLVLALPQALGQLVPDSIEIQTFVGSPVGVVLADPDALRRIVQRVVAAARDAMPDGGTIEVETSEVWLGDAPGAAGSGVAPGQYVCLAIADTGGGTDAAAVAEGVRPLMEQHAGTIRVEARPGTGTTVKLYFPVASAASDGR